MNFILSCPPICRVIACEFRQGDACALRRRTSVAFDLVLMANLIDRLPDPRAASRNLPGARHARRVADHHLALHVARGVYAARQMA